MSSPPTKSASVNRYPWYAPRFWHGMRFRAYCKLIIKNRFRFHFLGLGSAFAIFHFSMFNSVMYRLQWLMYAKKVRETSITEPPVFILGHWRSGTTWLHELMVMNERFASPTTFQCFAANSFLVTEWFMPRMFSRLMPRQRPMDNMAAGFDRPQEDEFALCSMNAPTPYFRMAFPNRPPVFEEFFEMRDVDEVELDRFRRALSTFFKALTFRTKRRLILKSPPHTGRIELLAEMFPGAKFVHLVRHPDELYPSTIKLWKTLDRNQGFQLPKYSEEWLSEYVLECFERMYAGFRRQSEALAPSQLIEIKYEELVADPVGTVRTIYDRFELEGFDRIESSLTELVQSQKEYRRSAYELSDETKAILRKRWSWYFERYGYE